MVVLGLPTIIDADLPWRRDDDGVVVAVVEDDADEGIAHGCMNEEDDGSLLPISRLRCIGRADPFLSAAPSDHIRPSILTLCDF